MEIKLITDKNYATTWDNFIIANSSPASFLQSWNWGEFKIRTQNTDNRTQKMNGVFRYGIYNDNELVAVAQFIKVALPGGKFYLNCPRGPIFESRIANRESYKKIFDLLINEIKKIADKEKIVFFRIAPPYDKNIAIRNSQFAIPKILTHLKEPENTLVLDLSHSTDELLKGMHQKTRYNIRLAEKKGVKISQQITDNSQQEIDIFYNLMQQTAKRDKINIFEKDYYKKLLTHSKKLPITNYQLLITLFIAEYNSTPLSSIIVVGFGNTATYLHGASSDVHRNLMPNHLIQWQAIQWAKRNGYKHYDFWGIQPSQKINNKSLPAVALAKAGQAKWQGISRFKRGFVNDQTGREINFINTFDYILNKKWYNLYRLGKFLSLKH